MINAVKFKEAIRAVGCDFGILEGTNEIVACGTCGDELKCQKCKFGYDEQGRCCDITKVEWLLEDCKIKLSCLEYEILKALETDGWFYIARDLDGSLFAYNFEPYKKDDIWDNDGDNYEIVLFKKEFKFVDWLDEKPVDIEEILNNCEVIRNERI